MIVMTPEEADKVRGESPTHPGHVLIPLELDDGSFMVGESILDQPAHAHVRDFLASLRRAPDARPKEATEEEIAADDPARLTVWTKDAPQERAALLEAAVVMLADKGAPLDGLKGR